MQRLTEKSDETQVSGQTHTHSFSLSNLLNTLTQTHFNPFPKRIGHHMSSSEDEKGSGNKLKG